MQPITPAPKHHLIGHRGVAGLRPENTYASFEYAAQLGLNWIEFDVQLTKDEQWVVIHDATLERTTNGRGRVQAHTLKQLQKLDAGSWFNPPYPGQLIPTLADTLALAKKLDLHCNIEIKHSELDPAKHAALMADFIRQHIPANTHLPLVSNFDLNCLIELRRLLPTLPIGHLIDNFTAQTIDTVKTHDFSSINCDVATITAENLQAAAASKIPVWLYTINDPALAHLWLSLGASAIFTDRADLFIP